MKQGNEKREAQSSQKQSCSASALASAIDTHEDERCLDISISIPEVLPTLLYFVNGKLRCSDRLSIEDMDLQCKAQAPFTSQATRLYRQCQQRRSSCPHIPKSGRTATWRTQARAGAQEEPQKAAGAIALGLKAYQKEEYGEAIHLFKKALELPGTGIKQYRYAAILVCVQV